MRLTIVTKPYNKEKLTKPWIAKLVMDPLMKSVESIKGIWEGIEGEQGMLILQDGRENDILMRGQKGDPKKKYYIVGKKGALHEIDKYNAFCFLYTGKLLESKLFEESF